MHARDENFGVAGNDVRVLVLLQAMPCPSGARSKAVTGLGDYPPGGVVYGAAQLAHLRVLTRPPGSFTTS